MIEIACGAPPQTLTEQDILELLKCMPGCRGMGGSTLRRLFTKKHGVSIGKYRENCQGAFRSKLFAAQYKAAIGGNGRMLEWLGKQYLGQVDKIAQVQEGSVQVDITYKTKWGGTAEPSDGNANS